jgi:hypothetical protein
MCRMNSTKQVTPHEEHYAFTIWPCNKPFLPCIILLLVPYIVLCERQPITIVFNNAEVGGGNLLCFSVNVP